MQGKLVWAFAFVGILAIISPASSCKQCGIPWCVGGGMGGGGGGELALPSYSRQCCGSNRPSPISFNLPAVNLPAQPQYSYNPIMASPSRGLGGNMCNVCGGGFSRNRGGLGNYNHGYFCRCYPRRMHNHGHCEDDE